MFWVGEEFLKKQTVFCKFVAWNESWETLNGFMWNDIVDSNHSLSLTIEWTCHFFTPLR